MSDLHAKLLAATGSRVAGKVLSAAIVNAPLAAVRAVVELHAPTAMPHAVWCGVCYQRTWPCSTIQAIAEALGIHNLDRRSE